MNIYITAWPANPVCTSLQCAVHRLKIKDNNIEAYCIYVVCTSLSVKARIGLVFSPVQQQPLKTEAAQGSLENSLKHSDRYTAASTTYHHQAKAK